MTQEKKSFEPQGQQPPGREGAMRPEPLIEDPFARGAGKLKGKTALITGGDSGIGAAVAIAFAQEGASSAIVYRSRAEREDADRTKAAVEKYGCKCLLVEGDVGEENFCQEAVKKALEAFGKLDILVNNAGEQHPAASIMDITTEMLERTFRTNILAMFFMTKAALPHLKQGAAIVNTASVTAYQGKPSLIDYSSTKGAIVSFTRSLALSLASQKIRVNAVAPGPIWTPLIPSTFNEEEVEKFGKNTPLGRAGQPEEVAPSYVFLASDDSSYMTGQTLHPNGGQIVNG